MIECKKCGADAKYRSTRDGQNYCAKCAKELYPCEVYSRIVGYMRPVQNWNVGKQQEYQDRKEFII